MSKEKTATPRLDALKSKQASFHLGLSAESRASGWLLARGYRILFRRYKTQVGEIDIVVKRGNLVAFVEVKARDKADDAAYAVTPHQQQRIIACAEAFLATNPQYSQCEMRFDVVLMTPGSLPKHLTAAFDASR